MRTPSLRRRITVTSTLVLVAVLLALDALLYLTLRARLEATLDEVLDTRVGVAVRLSERMPVSELAAVLTEVGVPATVRAPDGRQFTGASVAPRVQRAAALPGGGTVTVYAGRAGADRTLRRLLLLELAGTAAVAGLAVVLLARVAAAYDRMLTVLEAALDRSRRSDERNRRFLADAAHQLRTPITRIRTTVESLFRADAPDARDRLLTTLVRETGRTRRLLSALLRIARLDQGDPPARSSVDVAALCRTEVERAEPFVPHIRFDFQGQNAPVGPVEVDGEGIREAVSNLLDNARRHATGTIVVTVEAVAGTLRIEVADDGPGVRPSERELIFERFVSLDDKGGSGLGLPIARGVARAHGGDLVYTGAAFVLTVPLPPGSSSELPRPFESRSAST